MTSDATRAVATSSASKINGAVPNPRAKPGTYVAETYQGDMDLTSGGTPVVANDGEPAGLARVTLAMRPVTSQPPAPGRLIGLSAWAAVIGIAGLVLAIRCAFAMLGGAPAWFDAGASLCGAVGFTATVASFGAARWRLVPWVLLGLASLTLIIALILVLTV